MRTIYTVGHSNHPLEDFLALIEAHGVRRLADIRRFPASRRNPHFGGEALARSLEERGIAYRHFPGLGGRRRGAPDSPHRAWEVAAFRAYADHMDTGEFRDELAELERWANDEPAAVLCAEATHYRCHRRLTSDALLRDGFRVLHIASRSRVIEHALPAFARLEGSRIIYDGGTLSL